MVGVSALSPSWPDMLGRLWGRPATEWLSFLLFWAINIFIIYRGMDLLRKVENWAAPFVLVMTAALDYWAIRDYGARHMRQIREDRKAMIEHELAELRKARGYRNGQG